MGIAPGLYANLLRRADEFTVSNGADLEVLGPLIQLGELLPRTKRTVEILRDHEAMLNLEFPAVPSSPKSDQMSDSVRGHENGNAMEVMSLLHVQVDKKASQHKKVTRLLGSLVTSDTSFARNSITPECTEYVLHTMGQIWDSSLRDWLDKVLWQGSLAKLVEVSLGSSGSVEYPSVGCLMIHWRNQIVSRWTKDTRFV